MDAPEEVGPQERALVRELVTAGVRHLSRISASRADLERVLRRRLAKLRARSPDEPEADDGDRPVRLARDRLAGLELIDDQGFARGRGRSLASRGKSTLAIRAHLARHGIDRETAGTALDELAEEEDDLELRAARAFVRRKRLGHHRPADARADHRLADLAQLMRQGFPGAVARTALDEGEAEDSA